jgi:hypothetical protein
MRSTPTSPSQEDAVRWAISSSDQTNLRRRRAGLLARPFFMWGPSFRTRLFSCVVSPARHAYRGAFRLASDRRTCSPTETGSLRETPGTVASVPGVRLSLMLALSSKESFGEAAAGASVKTLNSVKPGSRLRRPRTHQKDFAVSPDRLLRQSTYPLRLRPLN